MAMMIVAWVTGSVLTSKTNFMTLERKIYPPTRDSVGVRARWGGQLQRWLWGGLAEGGRSNVVVYFFSLLNLTPKMIRQRPTTRSWPGNYPLQHLNYLWHQLWVDCCVASSTGGHLRPMPHLSHYFLMGAALATQTREQALTPPRPLVQA